MLKLIIFSILFSHAASANVPSFFEDSFHKQAKYIVVEPGTGINHVYGDLVFDLSGEVVSLDLFNSVIKQIKKGEVTMQDGVRFNFSQASFDLTLPTLIDYMLVVEAFKEGYDFFDREISDLKYGLLVNKIKVDLIDGHHKALDEEKSPSIREILNADFTDKELASIRIFKCARFFKLKI